MSLVTYNLSTALKLTLNEIERIRIKILLQAIPFEKENKLKWEARASKIYWSSAINGNRLSRRKILYLLSSSPPAKNQSNEEKEIIGHKHALEYIDYNWYATDKDVDFNTVTELYQIIFPTAIRFASKRARSELTKNLNYLNLSNEHPLIQAGIGLIQFRTLSPFEANNGLMSRIISHLLLYKGGYDFRGLLVLDEFWHKDMNNYRRQINFARQTQNLTNWLEYYTQAVSTQLAKTLNNIRSARARELERNNFWKLNERQKEILSRLKDPTASLTNRQVQKIFKVSQITASRDLTKLTRLGLLLSHGKGRSVFYTKV